MSFSNSKKQIFYIYLIVQFFLWILLSLTRSIASQDAMEAVAWSDLISFGTNKHPPLSGWLMGGFYNLFGGHDIAIYVLGQICLLVGYIFLYKLARFFMSEEKAFCSSIIVGLSFHYTYHMYINNYNCNILSMGLWPMIAYYFYKATKEDKIKDWSIFGIVSGLAFLAKYQVVLLFLPLFIYLLIADRKQFLHKGIYVSLILGFVVILPHLVWLYKTDFFSFIYITSRTDVSNGNTPDFLLPYGRIIFPIKFYLSQLSAILPCIFVYIVLVIRERNIQILHCNNSFNDKLFILLISLLPIIILGGTAVLSNSRVIGAWGSTMICFIGILMFYFFPIQFSESTFKYFIKWMYCILFMWIAGISLFAIFQKQLTIAYPKKIILSSFDKIWSNETNAAKLKYIGGNMDYIFQFRLYDVSHPKVILDTFGHVNPWIDYNDLKKSGSLILGKNEKDVYEYSHKLLIYLPDNYELNINEYKYKICNMIKSCDDKKIYYAIIPPQK